MNPSTFDGDIVQTSLLGRDDYTETPVTYDVNLTAETDYTYSKTPMAHLARFHLKRDRARNEVGGGDSEREGGRRRRRRRGVCVARKPNPDAGGVVPVDGRELISRNITWEGTHLSVGEISRYPRCYRSITESTRTAPN